MNLEGLKYIIMIWGLICFAPSDLLGQGDNLLLNDSFSFPKDSVFKSAKKDLAHLDSIRSQIDTVKFKVKNLISSSQDSTTQIKDRASVENIKIVDGLKDKEATIKDSLSLSGRPSLLESEFEDPFSEARNGLREKIPELKVPKASVPINESADKIGERIEADKVSNLKETELLSETENLEREAENILPKGKSIENLGQLETYKTEIEGKSEIQKEEITSKVTQVTEDRAEEKLGKTLKEMEGEPAYFDPSKTNDFLDKAKYFQKKAEVQQQVQDRAKALGFDNIQELQNKIKASQEKLSKYKRKYSDLENIKDLDIKPANPMKGKPLGQRLIWEGNFQVQRRNPVGIDLSPQVSYRLNRQLSVGIGGIYRIIINAEKTGINKEEQTYGLRSFIDFEILKSLAIHAEYEQIRMAVSSYPPLNDLNHNRSWVNSGLLGLKKKYGINKRINGNVQILYYVLPDKEFTGDRLIFRFGFELVPKSKE